MKYKVELKIKIPVVVEVEADNEDLAYQNAKIRELDNKYRKGGAE